MIVPNLLRVEDTLLPAGLLIEKRVHFLPPMARRVKRRLVGGLGVIAHRGLRDGLRDLDKTEQ
jgi:hypothetical protein